MSVLEFFFFHSCHRNTEVHKSADKYSNYGCEHCVTRRRDAAAERRIPQVTNIIPFSP